MQRHYYGDIHRCSTNFEHTVASSDGRPRLAGIQPTGQQRHIAWLMVAFHCIKSSSTLVFLSFSLSSLPFNQGLRGLFPFLCSLFAALSSLSSSEWWGWSLAGPVAFLTFGSPYNTRLLHFVNFLHPILCTTFPLATTIVGSCCRPPNCRLPSSIGSHRSDSKISPHLPGTNTTA
ncbi:hypothetical protein BDV11DRAFT_158565 [Aspergillus similis]